MVCLVQHLNISSGIQALHFLSSLLRILLVPHIRVARALTGATRHHLRVWLPSSLLKVPNIILCVASSWHATNIKQNSICNRESMRAGCLVRLRVSVVLLLLGVGYVAPLWWLLASEVVCCVRVLLLHWSIGVSTRLLRVRGVVFHVRWLLYLLALWVHLLRYLLLLLTWLPLSLVPSMVTNVIVVGVLGVCFDSVVISLLWRSVWGFETASCLLIFAIVRIPLH